ncbi:alpha/beta hydrolase [Gracilibacillus phocaeensis]|nr:alpha/beta hydrolase [Gracilibacillus phocaeensis]
MEKEEWIETSDQQRLYLKGWLTEEKPTAIIQIVHGMAEHIERYHRFAAFFNRCGIAVYGHDQRGHGRTRKDEQPYGFFADNDGFRKVVDDCKEVTRYIKQLHPHHPPVFLLGHSMGSFVARNYITETSEQIAGAIFVGTGSQGNFLLKTGKQLAKIISTYKGKQAKGTLLHQISFSGYNKHTEKRTMNDWLSTDPQVVDQYESDPFCGFIPTNQFFYDLYNGMERMQSRQIGQHIRKDLPLLFISGKQDPVGQYGKGVLNAVSFYQSLGIAEITCLLYDDGRHEILNEQNQYTVFHELFDWINRQKACQ